MQGVGVRYVSVCCECVIVDRLVSLLGVGEVVWALHGFVQLVLSFAFFFQAEDGIRDLVRSRGLGDVYKRQVHVVGI